MALSRRTTAKGCQLKKRDAFCHVMPRAYADRLLALPGTPASVYLRKRSTEVPAMTDLTLRFRQPSVRGGSCFHQGGPPRCTVARQSERK